MTAEIRELRVEDIAACEEILASLPEWFGLPESNRGFIEGLSHFPSAVAVHEDRVVGFVSIRSHDARSAEIEAMAIEPRLHHQGIGRSLMDWVVKWCASEGFIWLHVKTRGPATPDTFFEKTRSFYQAVGFDPLFESRTIWGPDDAALVLVRKIDCGV